MLIQIHDAGKDGKRKVEVSDESGIRFKGEADDLAEAHKLLKAARKHDWDAEALAAETKAAEQREKARVEKGKKAAEPKK